VVLLALAVPACSDGARSASEPDIPIVAFLFDGSPADAELVTAPALAGLELAAHRTGAIEIEPVNLGPDPGDVTASLEDLVEDRRIVAAVIAPWTAPPSGAIDLLATHGLPVVTLSWAWGPPAEGDGLWLSFVPDRAREAVLLLSTADIAPEGAPVCLAGDGLATSRALLATAEELAQAAGDPEVLPADRSCPVLAWTGGAPGAAIVIGSRADGLPSVVVGSSRLKTDDGLALATSAVDVLTVCACADVTLTEDPVLQRFIHDLQAESGSPPGPFAVEAYDVGGLLASIVADIPGDDLRAGVVAALDDTADVDGIAGGYAFEPDGSRDPRTMAVGVWRAAGSRWLPVERSTVPP
jgi:hypothetical protein